MGDSLLQVIARGITPRASIGSAESGFFSRWNWNAETWSGKSVTVDSALQLSTVWACVRLIANTISTLPLGLYERNDDGSKRSLSEHPLYRVLHNRPNPRMTAVSFWQVALAAMLLRGASYVEIHRLGERIRGLSFLRPDRVTTEYLDNGNPEYTYYDGVTRRRLSNRDVMFIPAFSDDGLTGLSPISVGANVFGTSLATEEASARTFKSAMRSTGVIKMDMILKSEQREEIRAHVKDVSDRGGVMVLEKGAGFEALSFNPHDAELLASRSFNVEEICRWFGVDPAMVGHGGKDSNWGTGLEQKMQWLLTFCLRPWCVQVEQSIWWNLLTPLERETLFAEFAIEGLLRADSAGRSAYYSTMTQNGLMTRDECRAKENLPMRGGNADVLTVQSNLLPIDKLGTAVPSGKPATE